jgi:hypothetical protein
VTRPRAVDDFAGSGHAFRNSDWGVPRSRRKSVPRAAHGRNIGPRVLGRCTQMMIGCFRDGFVG